MKLTTDALTLVAVDCAYPALAAKALRRSAEKLPAARVLLLTDSKERFDGVEMISIAPIKSRAEYSRFMLKSLAPYIHTSHALVVQWDGFVIHENAFADEFWHYDYIGAKWPHKQGTFRVGNGGFSLRSKKLLDALCDDAITYIDEENEDETICIRYREYLETTHGIAFADERVADRFAFDVSRPVGPTLGFHGLFNFWQVFDDEALIAFARTAPEPIAEGLGFFALSKNLTDLKRNEVAREFVTRILASKPHDSQALELKARLAVAENVPLDAISTAPVAAQTVIPPKSRNDPCPCGSGKRYKECHGNIANASALTTQTPIDVDALVGEALQLHQSGNVQAAVERYTRVLQQAPEHPTALHFIGLAQFQSGQPSAAMEAMWRSIDIVNDEPEFHSNYSAAAWTAGRYDEGLQAANQALQLNAEHVNALNNLGFNLRSLNRIDESVAAFDRALTLLPEFDYARWNRTFSLLAKGDYARGFADYELRLQFPQTQPGGAIPSNTPIWRGEAADGKTILLLCEQGLGDTFMFARFVPMVVARGLRVTLAVQASQVALMQLSFPDVHVVAAGEHVGKPFDYWAALWSLAPALGITVENLPAPTRFLNTRESEVAAWRVRLDALKQTSANSAPSLKIGIVWQGQFAGQDHQMADRSIAPRLMQRFVEAHPEHTWVSLQHGASALSTPHVIDWTKDTVEFTQMAALIDALDLVITIDTGAAHLAAALGARTWVLLREAGDWRYGISGERCAWSPTMQLFRQDTSRRWDPVFAQVTEALRSA